MDISISMYGIYYIVVVIINSNIAIKCFENIYTIQHLAYSLAQSQMEHKISPYLRSMELPIAHQVIMYAPLTNSECQQKTPSSCAQYIIILLKGIVFTNNRSCIMFWCAYSSQGFNLLISAFVPTGSLSL